jgi:hypothetical protein
VCTVWHISTAQTHQRQAATDLGRKPAYEALVTEGAEKEKSSLWGGMSAVAEAAETQTLATTI